MFIFVSLVLAGGEAGDVTETQKEFLYIIDTNVVRLTFNRSSDRFTP